MSTLSKNDYELLLECISKLYSFRELTSLRAWLLDIALPKLIPSDWLSYNEVDLLNPENTLAILKPESETFFQQLFARFREVAHQHPLITGQMQSVNFPVHKISDFLTQDAYHQLDLYKDVYRPMGVEYQIAATIKLEPERVTAFALSRRLNDYTERDRTILQMLRPHLVVACNNLIVADERKMLLDNSLLALNELASATLIVDLHSRILYHTGAGLRWIGATEQGILPARIAGWLYQNTPASGTSQAMSLISNEGNIQVRAMPTTSKQRLLLVLTQESKQQPLVAAPNTFGLSKRQSDVAQWICNGKSNSEIAAILGISPRTVQKHVEHIFEKLGVESRIALAAFLNGAGRLYTCQDEGNSAAVKISESF
jgi:DNA-binding CsgD family transcriptional regulator